MELPKHPATHDIPKAEPEVIQPDQINTNPFSRAFKGFDKLFKYNQTMAIIILVVSLFNGFLQFIQPSFSSNRTSSPSSVSAGPVDAAIWAIIIPIVLAVLVFGIVVSVYINGIVNYVAWKTSRLESTTLGESFSVVTKYFWTILVVEVSVFLRVLGGIILLIIPGIRAALRYEMVLFPVFDEELPAAQAINRMKAIAKGHLIEIFGVGVAAGIIPVVGPLLRMGGHVTLYPELKMLHDTKAKPPKVHWLNYLAFILIGVIVLLFIVLFAVLANTYSRVGRG